MKLIKKRKQKPSVLAKTGGRKSPKGLGARVFQANAAGLNPLYTCPASLLLLSRPESRKETSNWSSEGQAPSLRLRETRASELTVPPGRIHGRRNRQKININIKGTRREREGNAKSVSDCISFLLLCDQLPQIQQLKNHFIMFQFPWVRKLGLLFRVS